jgi:hypothetical protein
MVLLPNGGAAFRGLLKKFYDAQTRAVNLEAYLRREVENPDGTWTRKDSKGVSVSTSERALKASGLTLKGIARIESRAVRSLTMRDGSSLEIVADPPGPDAEHGNIVEIPYRSEDKETAERLAGELARQSELL